MYIWIQIAFYSCRDIILHKIYLAKFSNEVTMKMVKKGMLDVWRQKKKSVLHVTKAFLWEEFSPPSYQSTSASKLVTISFCISTDILSTAKEQIVADDSITRPDNICPSMDFLNFRPNSTWSHNFSYIYLFVSFSFSLLVNRKWPIWKYNIYTFLLGIKHQTLQSQIKLFWLRVYQPLCFTGNKSVRKPLQNPRE